MVEVTLTIQSGYETVTVPLNYGTLTVGRSDASKLMLNDDGLSRLHASIHRNTEVVWIVDEGSTNGSLVNGQIVPTGGTLLNDGDQISIGNVTTITVAMRERAHPQAARARGNAPVAPHPFAPRAQASGMKLPPAPVIAAIAAIAVILIAALALFFFHGSDDNPNGRVSLEPQISAPVASPAQLPSPPPMSEGDDLSEQTPSSSESDLAVSDDAVREALAHVIEDRGELMGFEAQTEIPAELQHYAERRRFLAIQTAEAREQHLRIPHDFAELAELIHEHQLVEMRALGDNYVLYGAGGGISDAPITHYDVANSQSVPFYSTPAEMQTALDAMTGERERSAFIANFYRAPANRRIIAAEQESLARFAQDFGGRSYDLNDPPARRDFKRRLLRFIRPPALAIIEELALAYRTRFGRYLPIASVIRTLEYQRDLGERNPNAARTSIPPHTTGLAFDISYRYMNAAEQNFLMQEIARMEAAGRVEALRENRNCYHVFVFPDGRRPGENLIRASASGSSVASRHATDTD